MQLNTHCEPNKVVLPKSTSERQPQTLGDLRPIHLALPAT